MKTNIKLIFKTLIISILAIGSNVYADERESGYQCVVDIYGEYQESRAWKDYDSNGYFFSSNNDPVSCINCDLVFAETYTDKTQVAAKQQFLKQCYNRFEINFRNLNIDQGVRSLTRTGTGIAPLLNNIAYENVESLKNQHFDTVRSILTQNRELCKEIAASPDLVKCEKFE